ncbi:twin-arginine translocase TatA/TatE family subunit [Verrucomicrobiota bacterium]
MVGEMLNTTLSFFTGSPGPGEFLLLFIVILLLFGPKRLPEIAKKVGGAMNQLRRASQDFKDQIMRIEEPRPIDITSDVNSNKESAEADVYDEELHDDKLLSDEAVAEKKNDDNPDKESDEANLEKSDRETGGRSDNRRQEEGRPEQDLAG